MGTIMAGLGPARGSAYTAQPVGTLLVENDQLHLHLSGSEKFWSFHRDVRVPLSAVIGVSVAEHPYLEVRGWRMTGVFIVGRWALGMRRRGDGRDFTLIHGQDPVVVIEVNGHEFGWLMVSVSNGEATAAWVAEAAGIAYSPRRTTD